MTGHPLPPALERVIGAALAAWVALLVVTLLAVSPAGPSWLIQTVSATAARIGLPAALAAPDRVEFVLNVAAFVPVSLLAGLLWPLASWRDWTAGGFAASFAVEGVQALVLDERSATHSDVVANTLGAMVGALLAAVTWRAWQRRASSEGGADLADPHAPAEQDDLSG